MQNAMVQKQHNTVTQNKLGIKSTFWVRFIEKYI